MLFIFYLTSERIDFTNVSFTKKEGQNTIKKPQPNKYFTKTDHMGLSSSFMLSVSLYASRDEGWEFESYSLSLEFTSGIDLRLSASC